MKKLSLEKNLTALYMAKQRKSENFSNEKNVKVRKRSHAYRSIAITYDVDVLNSSNPELQFKDSEILIKNELF